MFFISREVGVAGVAELISIGTFTFTRNNGVSEVFGESELNNTTYETLTDQTIDIQISLEGATSTLTCNLLIFTQE